jgi:electron transfer flavoprotein alpha subunit
MQGIAQCQKVVAINNDDSCDMVKRADLSAIGDSSEILDELLTLIQQGQQNAEVERA